MTRYPLYYGDVRDWDALEKILQHSYRELEVQPEDQPVFYVENSHRKYGALPRLTLPGLLRTMDRLTVDSSANSRFAEIMFEQFRVPALAMEKSAPLSLYSTGRTTGIVVESGDFTTNVMAYFDGQCVAQKNYAALGGKDMTNLLARQLCDRGYELRTATEMEAVRDMKERLCYVSTDFEADCAMNQEAGGRLFEAGGGDGLVKETSLDRTYRLPDGQDITVGMERIRVPESLFSQVYTNGLHRAIYSTILDCDSSMRPEFFHNIVLVRPTFNSRSFFC